MYANMHIQVPVRRLDTYIHLHTAMQPAMYMNHLSICLKSFLSSQILFPKRERNVLELFLRSLPTSLYNLNIFGQNTAVT